MLILRCVIIARDVGGCVTCLLKIRIWFIVRVRRQTFRSSRGFVASSSVVEVEVEESHIQVRLITLCGGCEVLSRPVCVVLSLGVTHWSRGFLSVPCCSSLCFCHLSYC